MFGQKNNETPDLTLFCMYDSKAQVYEPPLISKNTFTAQRELSNILSQEKNHRYSMNAEDFQLFKVGDFFAKTGTIRHHAPEHIVNCHEIKHALQN